MEGLQSIHVPWYIEQINCQVKSDWPHRKRTTSPIEKEQPKHHTKIRFYNSYFKVTTSTMEMSKSKFFFVKIGATRSEINRCKSRGVSMFCAVLKKEDIMLKIASTSSCVCPTFRCASVHTLKVWACANVIRSLLPNWLRISLTVLSDCNQYLICSSKKK